MTGSDSMIETLPENDPNRRRPDITRAGQHLGREPEIGLAERLHPTIDWFRGGGNG